MSRRRDRGSSGVYVHESDVVAVFVCVEACIAPPSVPSLSIDSALRMCEMGYNLFINHRFFKVCGVLVLWTVPHTTHERAHTRRTYNACTPNPHPSSRSTLGVSRHASSGARVVQRGAALKRCVGRRVFSPVSVRQLHVRSPHMYPPLPHRMTSNIGLPSVPARLVPRSPAAPSSHTRTKDDHCRAAAARAVCRIQRRAPRRCSRLHRGPVI